ncbi:hypothetical protein HBH80_047300 [Parastagonospora nodorum]|nr:hypothetical protein HBH80_047300 [Parastagonospora nodorum]
MSTSSTQNTNTTTGGRRAEIKKLIDDMMVDLDIPFCPEIKFFPYKCIEKIATPENIMAYIREELPWSDKELQEFQNEVYENAKLLFIVVVKNGFTALFLYQAVCVETERKSKYTDEKFTGQNRGKRFSASDYYNVKGDIRDQAMKELNIHFVEDILRGNFHQELPLKFLPIIRHQLMPLPRPRPMGVPSKYEVELHGDYWEEAGDGREFVMVQLDARPVDTGDAVAGFYGHHRGATPYWLLFPKGSPWLEIGKLTIAE